MHTIHDTLFRNPAIVPERECLMFEGRRLTFATLQARVTRLANALCAQGIRKGDRVVVLLGNCSEFVEAFYAITSLGALIVPLNWRLHPSEHIALMKDSTPVGLLSEKLYAETINRARTEIGSLQLAIATDFERDGICSYEKLLASGSDEPIEPKLTASDDASIIYTSGTTSLPKGTVLTHGNYLADHQNVGTFAELDDSSVNLQLSPLYHAASMHTFMHVTYGGRTVMMKKFEPGPALRLIEDEHVTYVFAVPTIIYALLDFAEFGRYDLRTLMTFSYGAAPMSDARLAEAIKAFGYIFIHAYGMTESSSHSSLLSKQDHARVPGSVGKGLLHSRVVVVDGEGKPCAPGEIGEMVISGPQVMSRYWNRPDATAETLVDGWVQSGDLGKADADGFLYVIDRKKDMIISGGVNLYPREIEEIIAQHPAVGEVAVYGIADEKWGEAIAASVVLRAGHSATADDISRFVGDRLARYKIPRLVEFLDDLPRNPSGKVLKRVLRDRHAGAV